MGGPKKPSKGEREAEKASANDSKKAQQEEDEYWKDAGEGKKSKAGKKKDDDEARKQEAAAKKAEDKRLAEQEEAEMAKMGAKGKSAKGGGPSSATKVTAAQLAAAKEAEQQQQEQSAAARKREGRKEMDEAAYARSLDFHTNTNRDDELVEASGMDDAIKALAALRTADGGAAAEKHPEKRMKAAWAAYEEAELPLLMQDKPGLKRQQYRDMLWKTWQKSPNNPVNQALLQRAAAEKTT